MEMLKKKLKYIIFLDIDGVLNSSTTFNPKLKVSQRERDNCIFLKLAKYLNGYNKHLGSDNLGIVITSTMRFDKDIEEWNKTFKDITDQTFNIIDITPICNSNIKGAEIDMWLKNNCYNHTDTQYYSFKDFIILDDDSDMLLSQINNFFKVDPSNGLTNYIVDESISYLLNDPFYFSRVKK